MNSWFSYGTQAKQIPLADNIDQKLSHISPAVDSSKRSWARAVTLALVFRGLIEIAAMNQL